MARNTDKLAILGGKPLRKKPFNWNTKHAVAEWRTLRDMFARGVIPMARGPQVTKLRELFCKRFWIGFFLDDNDNPYTDAQELINWPVTFGMFLPKEEGAIAVCE